MNLPPVDIAALHSAIVTAIGNQFPALELVAVYSRPGERIPTPAVLVQLDSIDANSPSQTGTEQLSVSLRFAAYCVGSYRDGQKLSVRTLTAAVSQFINLKRWGQPVGAAEFIDARPDKFVDEGNKEYEAMRIEWTHEALLGENVWTDPFDPPTTVWVSGRVRENKAVGPNHVGAYTQLV